MKTGLIGTWSPGIGDPSVAGWLTLLLYMVAAGVTWRLLHSWNTARSSKVKHEHWFWRLLFAALVLLGINKQLDLQSALTEIGRIMANRQGWYESRQTFQIAFLAGIAIVGITLLVATLHMTWGAPSATVWALIGSAGLVLFVIMRAASFHHVDAVLGHKVSGVRINWLLEMGGLLVITASAWRRRGQH